ncbi:alpha/beta fold hydrolase [Luteithermobacter gelatinilyticus]|uniref:alpha/beta fold hydrolase n=1 Tax=Luteithermobacter gelatinilyticus TaxID=2582913 RepID=UPI0011062E1F|nr:alpha/beta hydrolase [Luteithermobacter gelatinilyticus]
MTEQKLVGHTVFGSGPEKVIVLHGWWGDHSAYANIFPYLDTDTFSYVFMDYRGYGKSRSMTGEHSIKEIAQDVLALADHLGWPKFHVMGHSMGGMVVQRLMADAPTRLKSAVAVTPVPACGAPLDDEGKELFHNAASQDENRLAILNFLTSGRLSESWYRYMVRRSRETTTEAAFHKYMLAWTETDFAEDARGAEVPLLCLVGEYDQAITADAMRQTCLEWYPKATLDVMANSGHFPMMETPVQLITMAETYMKKHC